MIHLLGYWVVINGANCRWLVSAGRMEVSNPFVFAWLQVVHSLFSSFCNNILEEGTRELGKLHVNPTHGCTLNLGYEAMILSIWVGLGLGVGVCLHFSLPLFQCHTYSQVFLPLVSMSKHILCNIWLDVTNLCLEVHVCDFPILTYG
jgi:hypothetical protein